VEEFTLKHTQSIDGILNCFDRIIFKGYLPISWPEGMESFLRREHVMVKDFKKYVTKISDSVCEHAKQVATSANRPYIHIRGKLDKEDTARRLAGSDKISEGLICVFSRLEQAQSFRLKIGKDRPRLESSQPHCLCLYFYVNDRKFGLIHIRMQTWFPFTVQVYINGHEWLARQMKDRQMTYTQEENAFISICDIAKANRLAANFAGLNWQQELGRLANKINPLMKTLLRGMYYNWFVDQAEYSTDIIMRSSSVLQGLYPALVEHATLRFAAEDVLGFMGRKLDGRFKGEYKAEIKCRHEGIRIKHWFNKNAIKMYNKHPLLLRIETVINRPREFKVRRYGRIKGKKVLEWFAMSKRVRNLARYAEVSLQANKRYLQGLSVVTDLSIYVGQIDRLCEPVIAKKHRSRGLNPLSSKQTALFKAVMNGSHAIHGFTIRDIIRVAGISVPTDALERHRLSARLYRQLALLRAHSLIAKFPRSRRWRVTHKGHAFMSAALKLKIYDLPHVMLSLAA
jgi:hypothetical protein